jgi:rubredoxin
MNVYKKYKCKVCGFIYDPYDKKNYFNKTKIMSFENLPDDWKCPICQAPKSAFIGQSL